MTIQEFIKQNRISIVSECTDSNPNMIDQDWQANHYKVTLKRNKTENKIRTRRQFTLFYSMGFAIKSDPKTEDVLDCMAMDSSSIDQDFEGWANDLDYDTDSRKAEKTYNICRKQATKFENFLGEDLYNELLQEIDRL
jgi:hypothetical protein